MLKIFKHYNADMSILEDFDFYDIREKSLCAKRTCIPSLVRSEVDKRRTFDDLVRKVLNNMAFLISFEENTHFHNYVYFRKCQEYIIPIIKGI